MPPPTHEGRLARLSFARSPYWGRKGRQRGRGTVRTRAVENVRRKPVRVARTYSSEAPGRTLLCQPKVVAKYERPKVAQLTVHIGGGGDTVVSQVEVLQLGATGEPLGCMRLQAGCMRRAPGVHEAAGWVQQASPWGA